MIWTQAKAMAVLAASGTSAQGFLARLSEQVAAWVPGPSTTTAIGGTPPQLGSPPIGEPSGTIIISWSTQHFTVTTGIPDGSLGYGGTITNGGSVMVPIPTGGEGGSSQLSGAGDQASGGASAGISGDDNSQTGIINTNYGNMPPVLTESPGPLASVSGASAGGTVTDGLSGGGYPQPGSTADEDGVMASILTGGLSLSEKSSVLGATAGGTVADGLSVGGSQPSPVTDDGVMASILAGSPGNPQLASGSGNAAGGTVTNGLSGGDSQPGSTIADDGDTASVLTGGLVNSQQASVLGATAGGTIPGGLSGGNFQPSPAADDEVVASILAGGLETPQNSGPGPISDGGVVAPGIPRSSQNEPEPITDGGHSGSVPPTVPTGGSPASPEALISGTPASESAVPSSDSFVIQLGPAVAVAAVSSAPAELGAANPLGRRQDDSGDNQFLMNAGKEKSGDCSQATQFEIVDGELMRGGQKVSTSPGARSARRLAVDPFVGSITRSWEIVNGELLWVNDSFVGGRAEFCEDEDTRTMFFTTRGDGSEPAGCTPMHLTPMFVADCPGLNPDGSRRDLLPAEETLILPPGIYFPGAEPKNQACRVTTEYWTVGQFTLATAPTVMSRRL